MKKKSKKRPTWDEYFMKIAMLVAERSTCLRNHVGARMTRIIRETFLLSLKFIFL